MRRRHLESVSSRSLSVRGSWGTVPSVFWYGAPGGTRGPLGKGGAAERWRVTPSVSGGDPTWSAARDDAYAQKERPGGEPYRFCTLQNQCPAARRPPIRPKTFSLGQVCMDREKTVRLFSLCFGAGRRNSPGSERSICQTMEKTAKARPFPANAFAGQARSGRYNGE